jgi:hypothetical protein
MLAVYSHPSDGFIDDQIMSRYGSSKSPKKIEKDVGGNKWECKECGYVNRIGSTFCSNCSLPLGSSGIVMNNIIRKYMEDRSGVQPFTLPRRV